MESDGSEPPSRSRPRPTKRLKTTASNKQNAYKKPANATRKKPSKLANLPGMPIDILFEIFGHLHPYDLLKLSRTTKDFRRLLTSRSAITVWKDSLSNVPGLPECPPGMCEIAWANLVFSPHCHFCLSVGIRNIEWAFRFRICSRCSQECFDDMYDLYAENKGNTYDSQIVRNFGDMFIHKRGKRRNMLCIKSDFENVLKEYNALSDDRLRKDYISDRKKHVEVVLEHAIRCQTWERNQVRDRESELRQLREERIAAIEKKLIELGWKKDLDSMGHRYGEVLSENKLANRPQRLTERIWTNIKPGILEFMGKVRTQRLKRELQELVKKRELLSLEVLRDFKKSRLGENLVMPIPLDFLEFKPVKEINNTPADVEITPSSFDGLVLQLPELVNIWRNQLDRLLAENIKNDGNDEELCYEEDADECAFRPVSKISPYANLSEEELLQKMKLASTVYKCSACDSDSDSDSDDSDLGVFHCRAEEPYSAPLFYPHVLAHRCTSRSLYWYGNFVRRSSPVSETLTGISIDASAHKPAESVIKLAGLDPATAMADDMDKLDLRFVCNDCWRPIEGTHFMAPRQHEGNTTRENCVRYLFDWRTAIRHLKDAHPCSQGQIFTKIQKDELDAEIILEENACRLKNNREWRCIHCIDTDRSSLPLSFQDIKRHFRIKHSDLPAPIVHESCFRDFAAPNINCIQSIFHIHSKDGQYSAYKIDSTSQQDFDGNSDDIYY